jgi:nitrous oxide reductase accessory protein NosL
MVNARQATFLLGSKVTLCCEPSALCFASEEDALHFQLGFGGQVCTLEQAGSELQKLMRLNS